MLPKYKKGFTLAELLIVIAILAVLLSIVITAINPYEQISRTSDVSAKAITNDFIKSTIDYYSSVKVLPWNKDPLCQNEFITGNTLDKASNCISDLINNGQLQASYLAMEELKSIYIVKCDDAAVLCYNPKSKIENINAETIYDKFGVNNPGCPGHDKVSEDCYWCRSINGNKMCKVIPAMTPTPTSTPTPPVATLTSTPPPTPTPTPSNPWGQAAVFAGKVGGQNPPSLTWINQFMSVPFDTKMALSTNNVTVEAWIKPNVPTAGGYDYRIVNNVYKLTMSAVPNGANVSYRYYFDILSSNNACNRTVVYSDTLNWYPWTIPMTLPVNKTVSQSEFVGWKHVAGVLQNGSLVLYENGIKLATYNPGMIVCNRNLTFMVGAGDNGPIFGAPWYYDFFQGAIDEVRISDVVRYSADFTPQKIPFTSDSHTTMLYHFDGNANDSSTNNMNGSMVGGVYYINSDILTN
jgi:prepilin-type N-terminal cleavage/methylation domain-containing protein